MTWYQHNTYFYVVKDRHVKTNSNLRNIYVTIKEKEKENKTI